MKAQKAPWIAVCLLIVIIMFFLGTRYGQEVERANKLSAEVARLIPTYFPTPSPTQSPTPPRYINYKDPTNCAIQLTQDADWSAQRESTQSASLSAHNEPIISYSCADVDPYLKMRAQLKATKSTWGDQSVEQYHDTKNHLIYAVVAPSASGSATIYLRMRDSIEPLVATSFSLTSAK